MEKAPSRGGKISAQNFGRPPFPYFGPTHPSQAQQNSTTQSIEVRKMGLTPKFEN
jgi:hypothetical protein